MQPPSREKSEDFVAGMHQVLSGHLRTAHLRMIRPGERNPIPVGYEYAVTSRLNDLECNFIEMFTDMRRTRHWLHLWEKLRVEGRSKVRRTQPTRLKNAWQPTGRRPRKTIISVLRDWKLGVSGQIDEQHGEFKIRCALPCASLQCLNEIASRLPGRHR